MSNPLQAFRVRRQASLSQLQMQSLTQLYQPIMGGSALSLYLTLITLPLVDTLWSEQYLHSQLLEMINIGMPAMEEARIRLEGIGLLKTYRDTQSDGRVHHQILIYDMQLPFDAHEFFSHPNLSTALYQAIGDQEYALKLHQWEVAIIDPARYTEITASFQSVYNYLTMNDEASQEWQKETSFLRHQAPNNNFDSHQDTFDYAKFLTILMSEEVIHSQINQTLKDYVITSHQVFGLNEADMCEVVLLAKHPVTKLIQFDRIKEIAQERSQQRSKELNHRQETIQNGNSGQTPVKDTLENQASSLVNFDKSKFSDQELQLIHVCQSTSTINFLQNIKKIKGGFVTSSEPYYLNELGKKSKLPREVINVLVYYILMIEKRSDIQKNELERLANQWQEKAIKHAPMALEYIKQNKSQKTGFGGPSPKKTNHANFQKKGYYQEILPSWIKKNKEEMQQKTQKNKLEDKNSLMSEDEMQAKLKDLFGEGSR